MQLATQFVGGRLSLLNHNNAGCSAGSAMTRVVSVSGFQIRGPIMGASPTDPVGSLLCLVMLVLTATLLGRPGSRIVRAFMICLPGRLDCYRVERTRSGAGVSAAEVQRPSPRSISTVDPRITGDIELRDENSLAAA